MARTLLFFVGLVCVVVGDSFVVLEELGVDGAHVTVVAGEVEARDEQKPLEFGAGEDLEGRVTGTRGSHRSVCFANSVEQNV
jgi:hypothetical protein